MHMCKKGASTVATLGILGQFALLNFKLVCSILLLNSVC